MNQEVHLGLAGKSSSEAKSGGATLRSLRAEGFCSERVESRSRPRFMEGRGAKGSKDSRGC